MWKKLRPIAQRKWISKYYDIHDTSIVKLVMPVLSFPPSFLLCLSLFQKLDDTPTNEGYCNDNNDLTTLTYQGSCHFAACVES